MAQIFASPDEVFDEPTPGTELLDLERLDFSVQSLCFVDEFLDQMRQRKLEEGSDDYLKLVLRSGAYIGEVIRRNSKGKIYHWVDYESAARINKSIANFGMNVGTIANLWDCDTGLIFPLAKIQKFLDNGSEESVHFFARAILAT